MKQVYFIKGKLGKRSTGYYDYRMVNHVLFDMGDAKIATFRFTNKWSRDCWYLKQLPWYTILDEWIDHV